MANTPALECIGVTKRFADVVANKDVDFDVRYGEIHALLGENGAGKSTLMNVVYGLYEPEEGIVKINGEEVNIKNPNVAIQHGIGMVHQHFMLAPRLTVLENVVLGMTKSKWKIGLKEARAKVQALCDQYHFNIDIDSKIRDLSVGVQQKVEIIKILYRDANILIFDEPTAVLTPNEVEELIDTLLLFKKSGKSVVFISHKLWEVERIADRVSILRDGRKVSTVDAKGVTKEEMANMMVGRDVDMDYGKQPDLKGDVLFEMKDICSTARTRATSLKDINLTVKRGEVVGIAGVDGNGQSELGDVIVGVKKPDSGAIFYCGEDITKVNTRNRLASGIGHIPEDRIKNGMVGDFTIEENLILDNYDLPPFTRKGVFFPKEVHKNAVDLIERFDIRPPLTYPLIKNFSGGNQQKVVVAREFSRNPDFILAMQPVRGLDIGATAFVHQNLLKARNEKKGVLVVSADLDELLSICDRIYVIFEGELIGEFKPGTLSFAQIGLMMGGQTLEEGGAVNEE